MADPASGGNVIFTFDWEASWGVPRTGGSINGRRMGLVSNSLVGAQELEKNPTLRGDYNPAAPSLGVKSASGSMPHVLTYVTAPFWFEALFGNRTFSVDHHTSTLQNTMPRSFICEKAITIGGTPKYPFAYGVRINKMSIPIAPNGFLQAAIDVMAKDDIVNSSAYDASLVDWHSHTPFTQMMLAAADLKIGVGGGASAAVGYIRSGNIDFTSNLDGDDYRAGATGARGSLVAQTFDVGGTLKVVLDTVDVLNLMTVAGTECELDVKWTHSVGKTLRVQVHKLQFSKTTPSITGPGKIEVDANFMGYYDSVASTSATVTTYNDQADAVYA